MQNWLLAQASSKSTKVWCRLQPFKAAPNATSPVSWLRQKKAFGCLYALCLTEFAAFICTLPACPQRRAGLCSQHGEEMLRWHCGEPQHPDTDMGAGLGSLRARHIPTSTWKSHLLQIKAEASVQGWREATKPAEAISPTCSPDFQ